MRAWFIFYQRGHNHQGFRPATYNPCVFSRWLLPLVLTLGVCTTGCAQKNQPGAGTTAASVLPAQAPKQAPLPLSGSVNLGRVSLPGLAKLQPVWRIPKEKLPHFVRGVVRYTHNGQEQEGDFWLDLGKVKKGLLLKYPQAPLWVGLEPEACAIGEASLLFKGPENLTLKHLTLEGFIQAPKPDQKPDFVIQVKVTPDSGPLPLTYRVMPEQMEALIAPTEIKGLKESEEPSSLAGLPKTLTVAVGEQALVKLSKLVPATPQLTATPPYPSGASVKITTTGNTAALTFTGINDMIVSGQKPGQTTVIFKGLVPGAQHQLVVTVKGAQAVATATAAPARSFSLAVSTLPHPALKHWAGGKLLSAAPGLTLGPSGLQGTLTGPTAITAALAGGTQETVFLFPDTTPGQLQHQVIEGLPPALDFTQFKGQLLVLETQTLSAFDLKVTPPKRLWRVNLPVPAVKVTVEGQRLAVLGAGNAGALLYTLQSSAPPVATGTLATPEQTMWLGWRWGELWAASQTGAVQQTWWVKNKPSSRLVLPSQKGSRYTTALTLPDGTLALPDISGRLLVFTGLGQKARLKEEITDFCLSNSLTPVGDREILAACVSLKPGDLPEAMKTGAGATSKTNTAALLRVNLGASPPTVTPVRASLPPVVFLAATWPGGVLGAVADSLDSPKSQLVVLGRDGASLLKMDAPAPRMNFQPKILPLEGQTGLLVAFTSKDVWWVKSLPE